MNFKRILKNVSENGGKVTTSQPIRAHDFTGSNLCHVTTHFANNNFAVWRSSSNYVKLIKLPIYNFGEIFHFADAETLAWKPLSPSQLHILW